MITSLVRDALAGVLGQVGGRLCGEGCCRAAS
jgi:hypothetical protein